ncbi:MAG: hypothetical protein IJP70_04585 [Bacteroidales bacterium]|nr:hypothetical protein [Bacteroidales bacterium]
MKSSFNMKRVGALLRYDWMLGKNTFALTLGIIAILYAVIIILFFIFKGILNYHPDSFTAFPGTVAVASNTYFSYGLYAIVFAVTTLLTHKFCNPKTSTTYLALPGSNLEKFVVLLADYLFGFLAYTLVYLVLFYITMGIGYALYPHLDWMQNGLALMDPGYTLQEIPSLYRHEDDLAHPLMQQEVVLLIDSVRYYTIPNYISSLGFYLICCMCFRTNSQIKSIGINVFWTFAYTVALIIMFAYMIVPDLHGDNYHPALDNTMATIFQVIRYNFYAGVLLGIGFYAILYRQIARKQAK